MKVWIRGIVFFVLLVTRIIPNYKIPRCWAVSKEKVKRKGKNKECGRQFGNMIHVQKRYIQVLSEE